MTTKGSEVAIGADLPAHEEIIPGLTEKLNGLSTVHEGLGEAARSVSDAHQQITDVKESIDSLAASSQDLLQEVRGLRPTELASTLDASLARVAQETSEGLQAVSLRMLGAANETALVRERIDTGLGSLETQLSAQSEAIMERFAAINNSFELSLAAAQCAVADAMAASQQAIQEAITHVGQQQEVFWKVMDGVRRQQSDLLQGYQALMPVLAELQEHHRDLSAQIMTINQSADKLHAIASSTQATTVAIHHAAEAQGPALVTALERVQQDLASEIRQESRAQLVWLVLILVTLALVAEILLRELPTF